MPGTIAFIWAGLAVFYLATVIATLVAHGRRRVPVAAPLPRVSVIMPIKGAHPFLAANVEALARIEPFAGEVLLAVATPDDAAISALAPIVERHAGRLKLLVGEANEFRNPKLRNLAKAWYAAAEDTILFLDDSVAIDPALYRELLGTLDTRVAATTAAPVGTDALGLPAEIEAATCNGYLFRIERLLEVLGGAAAFGSALALSKRRLEAAGGLARLDEGPCEDNALSKALRAGGARVSLVPLPVARRIGRRTWREIGLRHLRWKNCAKCHDPALFLLEPLAGGFCFVLLGAFGLGEWLGVSWAAGLGLAAAIWYGGEALLHWRWRWPFAALTPLAWLLRDLLQPVVTIQAVFTRRVLWRGEAIDMRLRRPRLDR